MSSIESMLARTSKGKGLPSISPIVDLGNAISLKYMVPLGAHDIDTLSGDIEVRFSKQGDIFFPIDGFVDKNYDSVIPTRDELANLLKDIFSCEVSVVYIDKNNREFKID